MPNCEAFLKCVIQTAKDAAGEILRIYQEEIIPVDWKSDNSPLTEADRRANDIIVESLSKNFPDHAILTEESTDDRSRLANEWCWIVDPLDGTKEFIKRNGEFTVNIALSYRRHTVLGVVVTPVTGEVYYAAQGYGAWYEKDGRVEPIHVSDKAEDLTMAVSRSHAGADEQRLIQSGRIKNILQSGSSLKGCLVAHGRADVYYRFGPTMEWDTAAMQCIVEEAGGVFRQMDDTEMLYNRENSLNEKGFYAINRKENRIR